KSNAKNREMKEINTDSPINCFISDMRAAPTTLRTPISRDLPIERAVARLMKLIQAIKRIKTATAVNAVTYLILPPACLPSLKLLCSLQSAIGKRNNSTLESHRTQIFGLVKAS